MRSITMLDKNPDHHHVDDIVTPKPSWRTPRAESFEQQNQLNEDALRKTPEGRKDQKKRGLK